MRALLKWSVSVISYGTQSGKRERARLILVQFLPRCPKSYIHVFIEHVAVQKEIKEFFYIITFHIILNQDVLSHC